VSLTAVQERIAAAVDRSGREPGEVRLVAVTKERTSAQIRELYDLGHRDFGENRAQELHAKLPDLPADIRWHFIGPLQRNKVRIVRPAVVLLHSLDRVALAEAWLKGPGLPPPALLQVNIGREPQKHGVMPEEALATAGQLVAMGVPLAGVMAIAPIVQTPELTRPYFSELRRIRDRVAALDPAAVELSMGMTDDFEVAVEEGATLIRVGRAIFAP
jgi:PLP dependent protein